MKKLFTIASLLALTACVSTEYGPRTPFSAGGYEEGKISENEYWLKYTGANNLSKYEKVKELWVKRANELCQGREAVMEFEDNRVMGSRPQATFVKGKVKCI